MHLYSCRGSCVISATPLQHGHSWGHHSSLGYFQLGLVTISGYPPQDARSPSAVCLYICTHMTYLTSLTSCQGAMVLAPYTQYSLAVHPGCRKLGTVWPPHAWCGRKPRKYFSTTASIPGTSAWNSPPEDSCMHSMHWYQTKK